MKFKLLPVRFAVLALSLPAAFVASGQDFSINTLPEMLVTGSRVAGPRDAQPFGTSVITAEDIQRSGATTVNEAIMRLLGVPGRQDFYGGGDYSLDLRGFGATSDSNQVVVVDGIRINEADLGGTRLAGIPIESVTQIEVIRGSGAVLYGEGATGGVIIITTKSGKGIARQNSASIYAAAGSYGLREGRANATLASGGFSLDVNAMSREADNHRDNFHSRANALSTVAQWRNDWLRVGASQSNDELNTGLPGSLTAAQYAANPRQTTTPFDNAQITNSKTGVFAEADLGDWQLIANAGSRDKTLRSFSAALGKYNYDINANTLGLRAVNTQKQAAYTNRLALGSDYSSWSREVFGTYGSLATQSSRAFYFRDELTLAGSNTLLTVGARTEQINKQISSATTGLADRQNAWELGLRQPLNDLISVYGRVGDSYRLANVDEFAYLSPGAALLPQRSKDAELGSTYALGAVKVDARLYRSALTNEIGFDTNAGPYGANVNFDPTLRTGLELDGTYAYAKNLKFRVNAALRKSSFVSGPYAGSIVPLTSRRSLSLQTEWMPVEKHFVTGGVNWVGSQHPDFANACSMPAYATANVRYAYRLSNSEVFVGATNLTNHKYYTQAFTCNTSAQTTSIYPEPGRAVTAGVRVAF
jgi:iron complex outermembrane receptor protein